jgi:hypothetical protein
VQGWLYFWGRSSWDRLPEQAPCARRDSGEFERVYQGPLQLVEVSNLRSGYTYRFRVTAFNEASAPLLPFVCYPHPTTAAAGQAHKDPTLRERSLEQRAARRDAVRAASTDRGGHSEGDLRMLT